MVESILRPPIGFAHRGARDRAAENTLDAFREALRLGATGLESDVWLSADGVAVLNHDGVFRSGLRRRAIASVERRRLPPDVPALHELYAECGTGFELSLDVKDAAAVAAVVDAAAAAGDDAAGRLWLCYPQWEQLAMWRADKSLGLPDEVHLVESTRLRRIREGPERRAASLADAGVDAINMHATDWTAGLTTLFHRFHRLAFGWDAQFDRTLVHLLRIGCDAVYSDHVERMLAALQGLGTPSPPAQRPSPAERPSGAEERPSPPAERPSPPAERPSPPAERTSPPAERPSPAEPPGRLQQPDA